MGVVLALDELALPRLAALVHREAGDHERRHRGSVEDGRLTQEEADETVAALPERIASAVEEELRTGRGRGYGPRADGADDASSDAATADGDATGNAAA